MNENMGYPLDSSQYRGNASWATSDLGYYSCPGNNSTATADCSLVASLGYLYQWSAATSASLCPSGWTLPSKSDFSTTGSAYWPDPASDYSWLGNTTGWNRSYAGYRTDDSVGTFYDRGSSEYLWSSTASSASYAWYEVFYTSDPSSSNRDDSTKPFGFSARCLKN